MLYYHHKSTVEHNKYILVYIAEYAIKQKHMYLHINNIFQTSSIICVYNILYRYTNISYYSFNNNNYRD